MSLALLLPAKTSGEDLILSCGPASNRRALVHKIEERGVSIDIVDTFLCLHYLTSRSCHCFYAFLLPILNLFA